MERTITKRRNGAWMNSNPPRTFTSQADAKPYVNTGSESALKMVVRVILFTCMLATATAQDFQYKTNNGALTITAYIGAGGNVVVPGAIGGLPVKSIGLYAFSY